MSNQLKVLVTGGAGYIGSHICLELIQAGYQIVVVDNLSNSCENSMKRVESLFNTTINFEKGDIRDCQFLEMVFQKYQIDSVIHCAGLKAVSESLTAPLKYYENNVSGSLQLFKTMQKFGCKSLVFSSSATVYGVPEKSPIPEDAKLSTVNPYGQSKLMVENILKDLQGSDDKWSIAVLRYFNPVGAHESGIIGEDPAGIPNNLMPYIAQVGVGKLAKLSVFGGDYPTLDGTGVRDYIHVVDLAKGHLQALRALGSLKGIRFVNLGTGNGVSVLELVKTFEKVSGVKIPYEIVDRRPGDVAECYANPVHAHELFQWKAQLNTEDMCRDTWNWQVNNPNGYLE
jgi:UDP-glucose 4-epimerase